MIGALRVGLSAAIALWVAAPAIGETQAFRILGGRAGLVQGSVEHLLQDRLGYLWVGTQGGLARYDGRRFDNFGARDGLPGDRIRGLAEGPDGRLYVATARGIARREAEGFQVLVRTDVELMGFAVDTQGGFWCATRGGVGRLDAGGFRMVPGAEGRDVRDVVADPRGAVWVASDAGLLVVRDGVARPAPGDTSRQPVRRLHLDRHGVLWVVRDEGHLDRLLDGAPVGSVELAGAWPGHTIEALFVDRFEQVWLGYTGGLAQLTERGLARVEARQGFPWVSPVAFLEDRDGYLWIGASGGAVQYAGAAFRTYGAADGLGSDNTRPVLRDARGRLWVGTADGLSVLEKDGFRTYSVADGLGAAVVQSLAVRDKDRLWVGTTAGIQSFDGRHFEDTPLRGTSYALVVGSDGAVWAANEDVGLQRLTGDHLEHIDVPGLQITRHSRLALSPEGHLWVTGRGGISVRRGEGWRTYSSADGLEADETTTVHVDGHGMVWFAEQGAAGRLVRFDGHEFHFHGREQGLSTGSIYFIGTDLRGYLWLGTASGLDRFDGLSFRNYSPFDGYPSTESNGPGFWADDDGSSWFSTAEGLAHYDPRRDLPLDTPVRPLVRLDTPLASPPPADAERRPRRVQGAEVFVPTFVNPDQIEVEYRVSTLGEFWYPLEQRRLELDYLPPGQHRLEVRARRYGGLWSEPASEVVSVPVPLTRRPEFIAALVALSLVGVGLFMRWRLARGEARNRELTIEVNKRTAELRCETQALQSALDQLQSTTTELERANLGLTAAARLKSSFLANMSHEIRTPMNAVLGMASLLERTPLDSEQREYLTTMRSSGELLLGLINDILDLSKLEAGRMSTERVEFSLRECAEDVLSQVASAAHAKGLALSLLADPAVPDRVISDPTRLRQVLMNLLGNAVKFTSHGQILLRLSRGESEPIVRLEITDSGIGIPETAIPELFRPFSQADPSTTRRYGGTGLGLSIVRGLVEALGGTVAVSSTPGEGSTFLLELPMPAAADPLDARRPLLGRRVVVAHGHEPTVRSIRQTLDRLGATCLAIDDPGRLPRSTTDLDGAQVVLLDGRWRSQASSWLSNPRPPVVLLVPLGERPVIQEGVFVGVLHTPVRQSYLLDAILLAEPAAARRSLRPSQPTPSTPGAPRVLVAEDNPVNQRVIVRMLAMLGVEASVANDGAAAVSALSEPNSEFDLVLMDCQMPVVDGFEACRQIRKLSPRVAEIPVIALTANVLDEDRAACLAAGMNDFLAKPARLEDLERVLRRWLGRDTVRALGEAPPAPSPR